MFYNKPNDQYWYPNKGVDSKRYIRIFIKIYDILLYYFLSEKIYVKDNIYCQDTCYIKPLLQI